MKTWHVWSHSFFMKRANINGKGLTCTGVMMSETIHRNQRGENPDVPVGMISRFPMLDPVERYISNFHVCCAVVLMIVLYINFSGPKGNDKSESKVAFHVWTGRLLSWLIAPHYAIVGLVLNYFAVMSPKMEDWALGTDITGWRAQTAYITPFGLNVLVCTFMGFYLGKWMNPKPWATVLKFVSLFSIIFWMTIGVYMLGDQVLGGMGAFGLPVEKVLDGAGKYTTENQCMLHKRGLELSRCMRLWSTPACVCRVCRSVVPHDRLPLSQRGLPSGGLRLHQLQDLLRRRG